MRASPGWRELHRKPSFTSSRRWAAARPTCLSASACSPSIPSFARHTARECSTASAFESANIAAFNGRNNPDHFFWGEIANQLGKGDQFKAFWTSGPKGAGREGLAEAL